MVTVATRSSIFKFWKINPLCAHNSQSCRDVCLFGGVGGEEGMGEEYVVDFKAKDLNWKLAFSLFL